MKQQQPGRWGLRRLRRAAAVATLILLILVMGWMITPRIMTKEYASFTRSDGNYRVVVLRIPVWPALMPGQASDAPGLVQLYNRQGELIHETKVEMVQLVDHVEWTEKRVRIKLVAEWDLPPVGGEGDVRGVSFECSAEHDQKSASMVMSGVVSKTFRNVCLMPAL